MSLAMQKICNLKTRPDETSLVHFIKLLPGLVSRAVLGFWLVHNTFQWPISPTKTVNAMCMETLANIDAVMFRYNCFIDTFFLVIALRGRAGPNGCETSRLPHF